MADAERLLQRAQAQGGGTHNDRVLDKALADTFPASDPPSCVMRCSVADKLPQSTDAQSLLKAVKAAGSRNAR